VTWPELAMAMTRVTAGSFGALGRGSSAALFASAANNFAQARFFGNGGRLRLEQATVNADAGFFGDAQDRLFDFAQDGISFLGEEVAWVKVCCGCLLFWAYPLHEREYRRCQKKR